MKRMPGSMPARKAASGQILLYARSAKPHHVHACSLQGSEGFSCPLNLTMGFL